MQGKQINKTVKNGDEFYKLGEQVYTQGEGARNVHPKADHLWDEKKLAKEGKTFQMEKTACDMVREQESQCIFSCA